MAAHTLAIVVVTWNNEGEIGACLRAIGAPPGDWELWVVDNASEDGTAAVVQEHFPWVRLVRNDKNRGFAHAANRGIAASSSEFVLLLNPDTECAPGALHEALRFMADHPLCGLLGVRLHDAAGTTQPSCFRFPSPGLNWLQFSGAYRLLPPAARARTLLGANWDHAQARSVDWLAGAFLLASRSAADRVGPLSEDYFLFAEDLDWCYRFWQAGHEVWYTPAASVLHHRGRSTRLLPARVRDELALRGKYRFCASHYGAAATRFVQLTDLLGFAVRLPLAPRSGWLLNGLRESARRLASPIDAASGRP